MKQIARVKAWRNAAQRRAGEALFREARADFEAGTTAAPRASVRLAQAFALLILLTPFAAIAAGVWLASVDFPNLITIVMGVILCAVGIYVLPRRAKLESGAYRRDDLPEMFALCDAVAQRLGAQPLTLIYLDDGLNASYAELRGERVMTFGLGLWAILTPPERLAVIAHELAHQVNGDLSRTGVLSRGLFALQQWYDLFSPGEIIDHDGYLIREREAEDVIAGGIMSLCRGLVELVWVGLTRLYYMDSQRAEYLADALATRACGVSNAQQVLTKLALLPLIEKEVLGLVPSYVESGSAFYERISRAVNGAEAGAREKLLEAMVAEHHSVDMSHPPTFQRMAFLSDLPDPAEGLITVPGRALDAEIAPILERSGRKALDSLEVQ